MAPSIGVRDTSTFTEGTLPAILNEDAFWPSEPQNVQESGLSEVFLENLILQDTARWRNLERRKIAEKVGLSFAIIEGQMSQLRVRQFVTHAKSAPLNDY